MLNSVVGRRDLRAGGCGERASYTLGALTDASSDPGTNLQPNDNGECAFQPEESQMYCELIMHPFRSDCLARWSGEECSPVHSQFHLREGTRYSVVSLEFV